MQGQGSVTRVLVSCLLATLAVLSGAEAKRSLLDVTGEVEAGGKKWALLIAGSAGYGNYRHQADVYHAYQIVKASGIPDDNIVVMHYDDIANNEENPHKGIVINKPGGPDVYHGVPKDYTGYDVTAANMLKVLAGDVEGMKGVGSGKVISSTSEDKVFMFYCDHGGPGILGTPIGDYLYGDDLVSTIVNKSKSGGFKEMVLYIEACESGSILGGVLPDNVNVYATTAANAQESSWAYYCPNMDPPPPEEYDTCLGDLYSISFLEDLDVLAKHKRETLEKQYKSLVKVVSQNGTYVQGSHVMQYGDLTLDDEKLTSWFAVSGAEESTDQPEVVSRYWNKRVEQRDADLLHYQVKYERAAEGAAKDSAKAELDAEKSRRAITDDRVLKTALKVTGGEEQAFNAFNFVRSSDQAVVDDWDCLKGMVEAFEAQCGRLGQYGLKHARVFANMCNSGKSVALVEDAVKEVCSLSDVQ